GALRFYRDVLGLPVLSSWERESGSGTILDAGRATLELLSREQAEQIDKLEAGETGVSGPLRVALEVADSVELAERLTAAGAALTGRAATISRHATARLVCSPRTGLWSRRPPGKRG